MDPRRRSFLRGRAAEAPPAQRPPWSLPEALFARQCDRCHACVRACPRGVIEPGDGGYPGVDFSAAGCDFCGACEAACQPRALDRGATDKAWPGWHARVAPNCLALARVECRVCGDACDPRALRFRPAPGGVSPLQLDTAACTACGECVSVCPVGALAVVPAG
jgi:ferredoxin-type protein NapF